MHSMCSRVEIKCTAARTGPLSLSRGTPAVEAYPVIPTYGSRAAGACWRIDVRVEYENTKCSGES